MVSTQALIHVGVDIHTVLQHVKDGKVDGYVEIPQAQECNTARHLLDGIVGSVMGEQHLRRGQHWEQADVACAFVTGRSAIRCTALLYVFEVAEQLT